MTPDDGPSRETLVAQIAALQAVVRRQQRTIDWMRASRFWKLRDAFFGLRRRFGNGIEPLPSATAADLAERAAGFADPYQLLRVRERRSAAELEWLRGLVPALAVRDAIELTVDARGATVAGLDATLTSLREQVYPYWRLRVRAGDGDAIVLQWLRDVANADARVDAAAWDGSAFDGSLAAGALGAADVLEPDALLSVAAALNAGADAVYTDEDRIGADGIPHAPAFKPGWSPETELTRDYVGGLCVFRGPVLAAAGGLHPDHGAAMWYDALLRVSERTGRIEHVARVLYHRSEATPPLAPAAAEDAVKRALSRRGERADITVTPAGLDVRFAAPEDEQVTVIVPTRDRADLLERCLKSVFERTAHPSFEVIVVDNGSKEPATRALFTRWRERAPGRFRVLDDPAPFNFSRLNNRAVAQAGAPYVLLLNNDTEVIAPDWMGAMLGQARRGPIGAVGALLLYEDGTIQHAGVVLGGVTSLAGHVYRFGDPSRVAAAERLLLDTNYLAVTGACLMVARAKYEAAGGLDETLAVSYNDIDFCLKLHAAGYRNVVVPRARLYHYESKSRGRDDTQAKFALAVSERDTLRERWPEWARRDPYYNANLTLDAEDFAIRG